MMPDGEIRVQKGGGERGQEAQAVTPLDPQGEILNGEQVDADCGCTKKTMTCWLMPVYSPFALCGAQSIWVLL
jgi:hypothetical protein